MLGSAGFSVIATSFTPIPDPSRRGSVQTPGTLTQDGGHFNPWLGDHCQVDDEATVQGGDFEYVRQVAWRHPRAIAQRSTLPLADWGGRWSRDHGFT